MQTSTRQLLALLGLWASTCALASGPEANAFTVRTERYPRPPYSGATYYIYEQNQATVCTKLQVCNKYDHCSTEYVKGPYTAEIDMRTGEPYGSTDPVTIAPKSLRKHVCLRRYKLAGL